MVTSPPYQPVDYLIIGHLTADLTPEGIQLGGTAAYASLTARALGLRVGVVTAWGPEIPLDQLAGIQIAGYTQDRSTTFENLDTPSGREQIIHHVADGLNYHNIPEIWRTAPLFHLGPVAQEIEPSIVRYLSPSLIGVTPQGWLRTWDAGGVVRSSEWPEAAFVLGHADAAVISEKDIDKEIHRIEELAAACKVLVVTAAEKGATIYWEGQTRHFYPPDYTKGERTGAGDIFAALFFHRLHQSGDPWESGRFATELTSLSTQRPGLQGIPTTEEIQAQITEMIK